MFQAISYGTIPYLGTFLTDLTMIDTAIPDVLPTGLINFDKRRKEFEVLAQIKLLQGAANAYHIAADARFAGWFESVLLLDEREAFDLSCKLEPGQQAGLTSSHSKDKSKRKMNNGTYHRKNDSIASTASSSSESQFYFDTESPLKTSSPLENGLTEDHLERGGRDEVEGVSGVIGPEDPSSPFGRDSIGGSGRWSSAPSSAATSNNGATGSVDSFSQIVSSEPKPSSVSDRNKSSTKSDYSDTRPPSKASSSSKSLTKPSADSPYRTSEFYIIRVSVETGGPETEGVIMYKSIMIGNHERTREVIRNAMMKHGLEGTPDSYTLAQVLPDKGTTYYRSNSEILCFKFISFSELIIPANANVYYAVSTQYDLNFILREKKDELDACLQEAASSGDAGSMLTPKSGLRKGSRDASKARRKLLGLHL